MLKFLYQTIPGRMVLKLLTRPGLSRTCGRFLDSSLSTLLIPGFIRKNHIDMREFQPVKYSSFNAFFCRKIREGKRPVDMDTQALIAPCDGLLSAYKIENGLVIPVKSSRYSVSSLLKSRRLAKKFDGGTCLVFRLCVDHYHRYSYIDDGVKSKNIHIEGILHTVRPIALRQVPVFTENSREYTLIRTENFGDVVQMEVGAMLVGKIRNLREEGAVKRGMEKGYFLYGGSTVIVLLEKDRVMLPEELFASTEAGMETPVKLGQRISC